MTPIINPNIFCLLMLFGIEGGIYSTNTVISIDREQKTVEIEYLGIQSLKQDADTANKALSAVEKLVKIHSQYGGLKLESIEEIDSETRDYKVILTFDTENRMREYFGIDLENESILVYQSEAVRYGGKLFTSDQEEPKQINIGISGPIVKVEYSRMEHELFNGFVDI